jgi:preprotein translocase subunit SecE
MAVMSTIEQVKPAPVRSTEGARGIRGWWDNGRTFLTEVRNEMRRVTWPSRKEVYATTFVVLVTAIFFGVYLYAIDLGLTAAMNWLFKATNVA